MKYTSPLVEVIVYNAVDIIKTSGPDPVGSDCYNDVLTIKELN